MVGYEGALTQETIKKISLELFLNIHNQDNDVLFTGVHITEICYL